MHIHRKSSSSSSSGEERTPRRSNSFRTHNKRSLVASLTQVMPTTHNHTLQLNTKSTSFELTSPSVSEEPYIAEESEPENNLSSTSDTLPDVIHDPGLYRPSYGGVNVTAVWKNCTIRGWMTKHIPPSYSFTKTKKQRYVILADRMLYTFKTDKTTPHYREFFELTQDTSVFVTDYITGALFCIEITKLAGEKKSWYLQCQSAEHMKLWLDKLKKTVAWLREHRNSDFVVTNRDLAKIQTEHDALVNNVVQQPMISNTEMKRTTTPMGGGTTTVIGSSSSSESIVSSSSSPLRTSSYYDGSGGSNSMMMMDPSCSITGHQDLYYADQYDWDNTSIHTNHNSSQMTIPPPATPRHHNNNTQSPVSYHHHQHSHHPSMIPPQQPPPRTAPPPPPIVSSSYHHPQPQKFQF